MTLPVQTDADFEQLSWHDCHIWGISFAVGDPEQQDWTSDLVLDIDFIIEWLCTTDNRARFRVVPARLAFHGVTDPRIDIDWGDTGHRQALHPVSIAGIERERIHDQKVFLDRPYYRWRIGLNWPRGEIGLGAVGFTQTHLAEPVLKDEQLLTRLERNRLKGQGENG